MLKFCFKYLPGEVAFSNVSVDVSLLTSSSCVVLTVFGWPKISSYKLKYQPLNSSVIKKKKQLNVSIVKSSCRLY